MEITGKIIAILNDRSGISANTGRTWRTVEYLLETIEMRPRHMAFEVFGEDRIAACHIEVGEELTVSFDLNAHEYNGKWYNQLRAWQVQRSNGVATAQPKAATPPAATPQTSAPAAIPAPQLMPTQEGSDNDPLPFDIMDEPPF